MSTPFPGAAAPGTDAPTTLAALFEARCASHAQRTAYTFLRDDLSVAESLSYAELARECRALARRLAAATAPGDRVLLAFPPGLDFVRAFWACMLAGRVAVPVPAPDPVRLLRTAPRLRAIVQDAGATLVLGATPTHEGAARLLDTAVLGEAPWRTLDELASAAEAPALPPPVPEPLHAVGALAYLQYTSGSTATPRGVRVTHANVLANVGALVHAWQVGPDSRALSWLPHFHDYGLVAGVLAPLMVGAGSWLMSPVSFLRRPLRWLEAVGRLGITHTGAPDSAYGTCLRALAGGQAPSIDLRSLVSMGCGAEPIRPETIEQVRERFGPLGLAPGAFTPAYGLAEAVLGVAAVPPGRGPCVLTLDAARLRQGQARVVQASPAQGEEVLRVVGCGLPLDHTTLAIVDPASRQPRAPGGVGEIWVRSPSVGDGYWRQVEASAEIFGAWTAGGAGPFLRTGDLGFLWEGELFVTGRLKDLIIVAGENHYPQDIEWTAEAAHPAVRRGHVAAFAVDTPQGEGLAMALEVERGTREADSLPIAQAVRAAVAAAHGLAIGSVALLRAGSLPRTSSGKVQRRQCRSALAEGRLDVLARVPLPAQAPGEAPAVAAAAGGPAVPPRTVQEQAVWEIWRDVLGTAEFGVHDSFFVLGGHSLLMTQVASRIEQRLGVSLPIAALFMHDTVAGLAQAVAAAGPGAVADGACALPPIARVARGTALPASLSQRRMWMIHQFDPHTSAYHVPLSIRLRGPLDAAVLQRALDGMVQRHESLRTRLVARGGEPVQWIEPALAVPIEQIDLRALPPAERVARARALLAERMGRPFDLAQAPLHRPTLLRLDTQEHVLFWLMHHAITDNWSSAVLAREALVSYRALLERRPAALPPIEIAYADYAAWQRQPASTAARQPQLQYWMQQLRDLPELELPTDFARPARPSFRGAHVSALLPLPLREAVRDFCGREAVTPFMVYLSVFALLLGRQSGGSDLAIGTPIANRHRFAAEHLVGTLVNTLVMRCDLSGNPDFAALTHRVRAMALAAYAHQEAPFDEVVEALEHQARDAHHPTQGLVRVLFNVLNAPLGRMDYADLEVEEFDFARSAAQFDLSMHIDTAFGQRVHLEYATDLYAPETAQRMLENYLWLVEQVLQAPQRRLSDFAVVAPAQLAVMQARFDATRAALAALPLVHAHLASAPGAGDVVALLDAQGQALTREALWAQAHGLAHRLRGQRIGRGQRVGLALARGAGMVAALLGVLEAGAAYVPLDPAFPIDRLAYMVRDAGLAAIVTDRPSAGLLGQTGAPLWYLDETPQMATAPAADAALDAQPHDPAYLIYTSGSTGWPKGVRVPHQAVVNFLASMAREPGLAAADRLVAVTTLSFDIAVLELLLPLAVGAQLVVADQQQARDPHALRALLERSGATVMQATPASWQLLLDAGWSPPPQFRALVGGESLPITLAEELLARGVDLWNMYGPTETTVWSTCWRVQAPRQGIFIGRPIANTSVWVLDAHGHPCPIGTPGELCIGGTGVTLGYHERPQLTAERFIPDPWSPSLPSALPPRLYRTGDRGRWRHDGWLEHGGRMDHQVKLRGHRIELGEIEAVLLDHPAVAQCVVVVQVQGDHDARLVAYASGHDGASLPATEALRSHLAARLPDYMLPQYVVALPALPRLPNGKLDRAALPAPQAQAAAQAGRPYEPPATPQEQAVAQVWAQLLGIDRVGRADRFFDLGGHSLLAIRAAAALRTQLGWEVRPSRLLYEDLAQLARAEQNAAGG